MSAPDAERRGRPEPRGRRARRPAERELRAGAEHATRGPTHGARYARSRAKADAIRAQLQPLGPDERPLGIKLAVALALFIAVANLVAAAAGAGGESPAVGVAFALLMVALAAGLWAAQLPRDPALPGAARDLDHRLRRSRSRSRATCSACCSRVGVIGVCAPVFWLLVRVMARLQVPRAVTLARGDRRHRGGVRGGRREHDRRLAAR